MYVTGACRVGVCKVLTHRQRARDAHGHITCALAHPVAHLRETLKQTPGDSTKLSLSKKIMFLLIYANKAVFNRTRSVWLDNIKICGILRSIHSQTCLHIMSLPRGEVEGTWKYGNNHLHTRFFVDLMYMSFAIATARPWEHPEATNTQHEKNHCSFAIHITWYHHFSHF